MHLIVRRSARPHSRAVSATEFFLRGLNHRILGFGHRVNWQGSSDISTLDWRRVCVNNTVSAGLGRGAGQGQCQGLWSSRVDRCAHEHTCACTPTHTHTWALPEAYDAPKAFPAFSPVLFSPQKWLQDSEALLLHLEKSSAQQSPLLERPRRDLRGARGLPADPAEGLKGCGAQAARLWGSLPIPRVHFPLGPCLRSWLPRLAPTGNGAPSTATPQHPHQAPHTGAFNPGFGCPREGRGPHGFNFSVPHPGATLSPLCLGTHRAHGVHSLLEQITGHPVKTQRPTQRTRGGAAVPETLPIEGHASSIEGLTRVDGVNDPATPGHCCSLRRHRLWIICHHGCWPGTCSTWHLAAAQVFSE